MNRPDGRRRRACRASAAAHVAPAPPRCGPTQSAPRRRRTGGGRRAESGWPRRCCGRGAGDNNRPGTDGAAGRREPAPRGGGRIGSYAAAAAAWAGGGERGVVRRATAKPATAQMASAPTLMPSCRRSRGRVTLGASEPRPSRAALPRGEGGGLLKF